VGLPSSEKKNQWDSLVKIEDNNLLTACHQIEMTETTNKAVNT
jgi:hypothetical protein